ncbi:branched-chain amino acid ABC transporter permease [Bradyrhizobium sp. Cp5.3]|uniref:branched-chain amino acid ABC transporter permease n=1 Tax=Bradyrhizobium sp. Cp5.3 TaxID=443598 RepID=UPI000486A462|nr:branched-chain amino acid ABC transporter permease [Bradyrhizobium sp. Cp5.3]
MTISRFWLGCIFVLIIGVVLTKTGLSPYLFFAGYVVLQYVVLATAWNILGGYAGYVNLGVAGFFGIGVYSTVILSRFGSAPVPLAIIFAAVIAGLGGLGMGYLTLRLRGVFFSIATLALTIVLQTLILNWEMVGGARGVTIVVPAQTTFFSHYIHWLFVCVLFLSILAVGTARWIQAEWIGRGLAAIRDDESAAECAGVPTLRLKLLATVLSGSLMGAVGALYPFYVGFVDPQSAFSLVLAVNTLAMPLVGGIRDWRGPVLGAAILGTTQVVTGVTSLSAISQLIIGGLLVTFVVLAPNGLMGVFGPKRETAAKWPQLKTASRRTSS